MAMEFISILTDLNIRVNGKTISNMALEQSTGVTRVNMSVSMWTPRRKERENTCGQMERSI